MKIVLTGATGFVGSTILKQLLERPEITCITCLVRRPISVSSSKVETILHSDFSAYDLGLAAKLADHAACIWALGGKASDNPNSTEYLRATHTFTVAFARAVAERQEQPFRFCYLSGMGADPTESSTFPWEKTTRHLKGRTERDLQQLTAQYPLFSATSFRPAGILPEAHGLIPSLVNLLLAPISIRVDRLAAGMIQEATSSIGPKYRVVSNAAIKKMAMNID